MSKKSSHDKSKLLGCLDPRKNAASLFLLVVSLSALIYAIIYLFLGNGRFSDVFFIRCADFFMDFFNSIRDASQGSAVYTERGVIYPPMAKTISP